MAASRASAVSDLDPESRETPDSFAASRLELVFSKCFAHTWRARLVGGASEPYYQPASDAHPMHSLFYRSDYFASALHEVAHWCIAGERRRQLADFGYWYAPDGRDREQQTAFEKVEAGPQALEWLFSLACGYRFCISVDNLDVDQTSGYDSDHFKQRVLMQARIWQQAGLPQRAELFFQGLAHEFGTGLESRKLRLDILELRG